MECNKFKFMCHILKRNTSKNPLVKLPNTPNIKRFMQKLYEVLVFMSKLTDVSICCTCIMSFSYTTVVTTMHKNLNLHTARWDVYEEGKEVV